MGKYLDSFETPEERERRLDERDRQTIQDVYDYDSRHFNG